MSSFSRRDFIRSSGALVVSFSGALALEPLAVTQGQFGTRASHIDPRQLDFAQRTLDDETVFAHRLQMRAARDERHLAAAGGEPCAEIAAHRSRAHDGDTHVELLGVIASFAALGGTAAPAVLQILRGAGIARRNDLHSA